MKKGQQISPWSIYNQNLLDFPLASEEIVQEEPQVYNKQKIRRRVSALNYNYSELMPNPIKNKKQMATSTIETSKTQDQMYSNQDKLKEKKEQKEVKGSTHILELKQEANVVRELLEKQAILAMIKQELHNDEGHSLFSHPKTEDLVERHVLQSQSEKISVFLPKNPHRKDSEILKLPKIGSFKEVIIQNYKILQNFQPNQKEADQELVHKLLKHKIEMMISEKMKVLSKKKQLINREKPYNFQYRNI